MKQPYLDDVLSELKIAAFRNSVRLFQDSCTLYTARAYPTAFALGVLAYEELGKALHVQRISDSIEFNPGSEAFWYEALLTSPVLTDHRLKQASAFYDSVGPSLYEHPIERAIRSGELEREKQQALYVELLDDEVLTPTRINDAKAYRLLKHFVEALGTPPGFDWAVVELDGESNRRSGWLASEQLGIVRRAFAACEAPS